MLADIFSGCQTRYAANSTLVTIGRKLVYKTGDDRPNYVRPCVLFSATLIETLDDFATDTSHWSILFELLGKKLSPADAGTWLTQMENSFEDAIIEPAVTSYRCRGTKMIRAESQTIAAGGDAWDAVFGITMYADRVTLIPAARGA